jgi:iron complex outermembrane receptor protein
LSAAALLAQNGSLSGTVLDPLGKVLPGATVVVKGENGVTAKVTNTDSTGHYSIAGLAAGTYSVEVAQSGFTPSRREGVKVAGEGSTEVTLTLRLADMSQSVTVEATASVAAEVAPVQTSLDVRSARSEISADYIDKFTAPTSDYTEMMQIVPGTFSVNPNGVGLGDSKTYFRGFSDGQYTMKFDGIPFEDTNSPTHHSWSFFPAPWVGGIDFDRSPGSASTIGPTNFGGSINILSKTVPIDPNILGTVSYGSWNTRLLDLAIDSGSFFPNKKSSLIIDIHQLNSDGYQTFNFQKRVAGSIKYEYKVNDKTTITMYTGIVDLFANTPNNKGATRSQIQQYGDNFLMTDDPKSPVYFRYNFYHVASDFAYIGEKTELGHGWYLDNKSYFYRYWNKQNYNSVTTISATSGIDKLNGYSKFGDVLSVNQESRYGVFRTGIWYEWAYTDRYQIPTDPRTWVNQPLPNFHEHFITQTYQPFVEYEWHATSKLAVTAGFKPAIYLMHLNQFADNGKTVGNLGGVQFVTHDGNYHVWMPSVDMRYRLKNNWSMYAQYSKGSVIPPSSIFDTKGAQVAVLPEPTTTDTYQAGTVYKTNRLNADFDAYFSRFQNAYSSAPDPATGEPVYYLPGGSKTKGVEGEATYYIAGGFSVYGNFTAGRARYSSTGLYVANAPIDTEAGSVSYQHKDWDIGFFSKRIGTMYNDNGSTNQAVKINPFTVSNLFFNYTIKGSSFLRGSKFKLSVNNLFDNHSIVGVTPASTSTSAPAPGDVLTLLPGRSIMVTFTAGWAPRK